jgi:DNA-binding FadR family transcriptional regulator
MSISAVSSNTFKYQPTAVDDSQSRKNAFQSLATALQSGDLQQAQQAYNSLTQNSPIAAKRGTNPVLQDFQAIGTALQSGDVSGAQKALTTFQDALKTAMQGHHGHHHKTESAPPTSSTSSTDNTIGGAIKSVVSTAINLLA